LRAEERAYDDAHRDEALIRNIEGRILLNGKRVHGEEADHAKPPEAAGELFARGNRAPAVGDAQKVIDDLHRKIGQLQDRGQMEGKIGGRQFGAMRRRLYL
jgi:hypothetical protein